MVVAGWARVLVRGPSMSPTLADGDVLLVRLGAAPGRGDLVLVRWPARPGQLSVKRAVRPLPGGWEVLGDNLFGSTDSRELGPAAVLGVARWRLWPRPGRPARRDPARSTDGDPARSTDGDPARTADGDPARSADGDPAGPSIDPPGDAPR